MNTDKNNKNCLVGLDAVGPELRGCSLTIGNFDGVHLGHQRIVQVARELAQSQGRPVVALTFEPPPELVLRPRDIPLRVLPHDRRCCALLNAGADVVVTAEATAELLSMPPRRFVEEIIVRRFGPLHVVEGQDFHFGAKRSGDVSLLDLMGRQYGFALHVVQAVMLEAPDGAVRITSSLIRRLVAAGDVQAAARCLGRPYALYGTIIAGQGQGRLMEFPTANISAGQQVVPADGVYAGRAVIDGRTATDVREYPAAISVGHKPTLGPTSDLYIEAFLLDVDRGTGILPVSGTGVPPVGCDFYGRAMELSFLQRLRPQERFADADALRRQIAKDVAAVREIILSGK